MYCVYVLKSEKNKKRYTGYTSKSAKERLAEHNSGCNRFTKANRPYKIARGITKQFAWWRIPKIYSPSNAPAHIKGRIMYF